MIFLFSISLNLNNLLIKLYQISSDLKRIETRKWLKSIIG
ncbi:hypothetical protein E34_2172 [Lactococcus lactis subsp. lactis]|uniref:Uncharacterized protein n=1 Tax=Lactococcus lactis subsp. lactis TaxID=1360 RepID=A0A0V8BPR6_LACLL|nr:hypothetical protein E34_2172 [Lactococcus lactis subsp. lactis]KZK11352.1 hypothetical protein DRA4_1806 [Lactococcus lactis subsp. lactis bv. diacetylactis]KST84571.1 hypothetical protein KF7_1726 [Lactococcus lactis subsp. lactis]KST88984.1 hypothetical protein LKF67_1855 [Lactococcus lactis subsp. lactis]KST91031.1 hypothetical protein KF134_1737 [Lactococcus lactis subsp. lactis]